jgi:ankyrin repeat protein
MAALEMGGGTNAWVQPSSDQREAMALEAVKLAVDLGVDVNAADTDGRTALNAAKDLRYNAVVQFLVEKGAKANSIASKKQVAPEVQN